MRRLLLLTLLLAFPALAQNDETVPPICTVAQLTAGTCAPAKLGTRVRISNGNVASGDANCASGTGAFTLLCEHDGSNWVSATSISAINGEIVLVDRDGDGVVTQLDLADALTACGSGYNANSGGCKIIITGEVLFNDELAMGNNVSLTGDKLGIVIEGVGGPAWQTFGAAPVIRTKGAAFRWNGGDGMASGVAAGKCLINIKSAYNLTIKNIAIWTDYDGVGNDTTDAALCGIKSHPKNTTGTLVQGVNIEGVSIVGAVSSSTDAYKTFVNTDVSAAANTITVTGHPWVTGQGPMILVPGTSGGSLPAATPALETYGGVNVSNQPLANVQFYYVRSVDANTIKLYTTRADANADTNVVDITGTGSTTPNVIDQFQGIGVYITGGDAGPPISSQTDKLNISQSWIMYHSVGLWHEANQGLAILVDQRTTILSRQESVQISNGSLDITDQAILACITTSCAIIHTVRQTSGGPDAIRVSNLYVEFGQDRQVFMRLSGQSGQDGSGTIGTQSITVVNGTYLNFLVDDQWLVEGTAHGDITFLNTWINPQNDEGPSVDVENYIGQGYSTLDLRGILARTNNRSIGQTVSGNGNILKSVRSAGHIQVLLPDQGQETIDWSGLSSISSDIQRCIYGTGFSGGGASAAIAFPGLGLTPAMLPAAATAIAFSSASLYGRQPKTGLTTTAQIDQSAYVYPIDASGNLMRGLYRGATANLTGGFTAWFKWANHDVHGTSRLAVGVFSAASFTAASDPSAAANSAESLYFGCDAAGANMTVCSNDGAGAAACTDLGASYPCQTDSIMYEGWIYVRSGSGGHAVAPAYRLKRLDSHGSGGVAFDTMGQFDIVTSGGPGNTTAMGPAIYMNSGTAATAVTLGVHGLCQWANY